jgi:hypothetical protein
MYYDNQRVEIHRAARQHGATDADIQHAAARPIVVADIEPDADPPKLFVIGPDTAGNLLELVMLILVDDRLLIIHAMPLRRAYYGLLPADDGGFDGN